MKQLSRKWFRSHRTGAWALVILAIFILGASWWASSLHFDADTGALWGQLGDYYGGIAGTLLSAATLVALAFNLALQGDELEKTQQRLRRQTIATRKQVFEATFFQLLQRFTETSHLLRERNRFESFTNVISAQFLEKRQQHKDGEPDLFRMIEHAFSWAYDFNKHDRRFGPYFRAFFHLIKLVDTARFLSVKEKDRYTSIARAQLASDELLAMFLNAVAGEEGRKGLKPLVEEYGLFKHLRNHNLPDEYQVFKRERISIKAFQSSEERRKMTPNISGERR